MRWIWPFLFLLTAWCRDPLVPNVARAEGEIPSKERILSEYSKAVADLNTRYSHCRGEGTFATVERRPGRAETRSEWKVGFAFTGPNGRLIETFPGGRDGATADQKAGDDPRGAEVVLGYNDRYSYTLSRASGASEYLIRSFEAGPKGGRRAVFSGPGRVIHCATRAHNVPVENLLVIPGFRIDRVAEIRPPGQPRRLRIDFAIPWKPVPQPNMARITSGWLVVAPEDGWVLHESGITHTNAKQFKTTEVGHVEYVRGSDGSLQPVRSDSRNYHGEFSVDPATSDPGALPNSEEEFRFASYRNGDTPGHEFTLGAFGLPEYGASIARRPRPSYPWWIFGAALLAIGIALGLRWLSARPALAKKTPG